MKAWFSLIFKAHGQLKPYHCWVHSTEDCTQHMCLLFIGQCFGTLMIIDPQAYIVECLH